MNLSAAGASDPEDLRTIMEAAEQLPGGVQRLEEAVTGPKRSTHACPRQQHNPESKVLPLKDIKKRITQPSRAGGLRVTPALGNWGLRPCCHTSTTIQSLP